MRTHIPLFTAQRAIMREFYALPPLRVVFAKAERDAIREKAKKGELPDSDLAAIRTTCPALHHQIVQHGVDGENIQSAVFDECAYAQTLANLFRLTVFRNCLEEGEGNIPKTVLDALRSYALYPRYAYVSPDGRRLLIQAGGHSGVDSALITVLDMTVYSIEFKEAGAKASENDLPPYGEDGCLSAAQRKAFLAECPQYAHMLNEHPELNFFEAMGHNIRDFSAESVIAAVTDNYAYKKYADVVCTEDKRGMLVMLPANQIALWAKIEGEIRPSGRNSRTVWTPKALLTELTRRGAQIDSAVVSLRVEDFYAVRRARGGNNEVSGLKINPLFFVRVGDCRLDGGRVVFRLDAVRQLKPTIAAKMFFKGLDYGAVAAHYAADLG